MPSLVFTEISTVAFSNIRYRNSSRYSVSLSIPAPLFLVTTVAAGHPRFRLTSLYPSLSSAFEEPLKLSALLVSICGTGLAILFSGSTSLFSFLLKSVTKQQISKQDADDQNNKLYCKAGEKAAQEQTKGKAKKSESA